MKKIILLTAACFYAIVVFAQNQRLILVEQFTQASCGPCASQNPAFNTLLQANISKAVSIKYQTSWPGIDPMNSHNPAQIQARVDYYSVNGVPYAVVDGSSYTGAPGGVTQTMINNEYAKPSPFTISLTHNISADLDSIYITAKVKGTDTVTGTLKAHIAIVETEINFETPPGTNGETEFYNVMKRMLPNSSGTTMPATMLPGDSIVITTAWKLANIYDLTKVAVVSFVQNNTTKEVYQAGYSAPNLTPSFSHDVQPVSVKYPSDLFCGNTISPQILIRNNGGTNLTSLKINYKINNDSVNTYEWTGNLAFMETATITLPVTAYNNLYTNNELIFYTSLPNGTADELMVNDTISKNFSNKTATPSIYLEIKPDAYGSETRWELINSTGTVLYSGGPYTNGSTNIINKVLDIPANDCYNFIIYDEYGDGINSPGYYKLTDADGQVIRKGGGSFGNYAKDQSTPFEVNSLTSARDGQILPFDVHCFPNPARGIVQVDIINLNQDVMFKIVNAIGETLFTTKMDPLSPQLNINTSNWSNGIYFCQLISKGSVIKTQKIAINH